jgi:hypothetical protein
MDEAKAVEFAVGIFIVLSIFNYLYPGASFLGFLFSIFALFAAYYVIRGVMEWALGKGTMHIWFGAGIIMILVLFFNGLGLVINTFNTIIAVIAGIVAAII